MQPPRGRRFVSRTRNYCDMPEYHHWDLGEDDKDVVGGAGYEAILRRTAPRLPEPLNNRTLSKFLRDATCRGAPIEGGFLNNIEIHVICSAMEDMFSGSCGFVAHYTRFDHSLEFRTLIFDMPTDFFGDGIPNNSTFLVGLSMGFNQRYPPLILPLLKYPEKRLNQPVQVFTVPINPHVNRLECHVELGRAVASLAYAAAALGWEVRLLGPALGLRALKHLMGLTEDSDLENEGPMAALIVFAVPDAETDGPSTVDVLALNEKIIEYFNGDCCWVGRPYAIRRWDKFPQSRILSMALRERVHGTEDLEYAILDRTPAAMTVKDFKYSSGTTLRRALHSRSVFQGADIDGSYAMDVRQFEQFVLRFCAHEDTDATPRRVCFPHGLLPWSPRVNVFFKVNRVNGLAPGLYCLARNTSNLPIYEHRHRTGRILEHPALESKFFRAAADLQVARPVTDLVIQRQSPVVVAMVTQYDFEREDYIWEAGMLGEMLIVEAQAQGLTALPLYSQYYRHFWPESFGVHPRNGDFMCVYVIAKKKIQARPLKRRRIQIF